MISQPHYVATVLVNDIYIKHLESANIHNTNVQQLPRKFIFVILHYIIRGFLKNDFIFLNFYITGIYLL